MSNTKIVIDKDVFDSIQICHDKHGYFQGDNWGVLKRVIDNATEIQIDQSIEENSDNIHIEIARAKGQLLGIINGLNLKNETEVGLKEILSKLDLIQRCATQQRIIEQLKVKDLEICIGCGRLSNEPIDKSYLSCCPDNKYIPIRKYWFHSTYLNK